MIRFVLLTTVRTKPVILMLTFTQCTAVSKTANPEIEESLLGKLQKQGEPYILNTKHRVKMRKKKLIVSSECTIEGTSGLDRHTKSCFLSSAAAC